MAFPLYSMLVGEGDRKVVEWHPLRDAGIVYDSGWVRVEIGGQVLQADGTVREITMEERRAIADLADEWSGSK
jgi:hypothetical protein